MTTLTLWHGTTLSAARRIFQEGMHYVDGSTAVRDAAQHFDVDEGLVRRLLADWDRLPSVLDDQDAEAWFSMSRAAATCWAQCAPRTKWYALWAVWCIENDAIDDWSPWSNPEASAWHVDNLFDDPPAVVEVRAPAADVRIDGLPTGRLGEGPEPIGDAPVLDVRVRLPVSSELVVGYDVVNRRISLSAAAGLAGSTVEQLLEMSANGHIVPLRDPGSPAGNLYWTIDDLFDLLDDP